MAKGENPKWLKEIEEILRQNYQGDEFQERLKMTEALLNPILTMEPPPGDLGKVVNVMLKAASEELCPLAAVYSGFQLGVAWERYQNANRARKP